MALNDQALQRGLLGRLLYATLVITAALVALMLPASAGSGDPGYGLLKMEAGTWNADLSFTDSKGKTSHYRAVQKNTLIANGTWMINDLYMPMLDPRAPRYHGHGVWTYNPTTKRYEGIWVDNNFASMRHDTGTYDPATSTLYWYGEQPDYKGHTGHFRFEEKFKGKSRIFRMYAMSWKTGKQRVCGTLIFSLRPGTEKINEDDTSKMP